MKKHKKDNIKDSKLFAFGSSVVGTSHITREIPCQDYSNYRMTASGWMLAVIADGVGSAKHSDEASRIACETFLDFCEAEITKGSDESRIAEIIKTAYQKAMEAIENHAEEAGNPINDYDTTMDGIVYNGKTLIYGHSGDGGIIGLKNDGTFVKVTRPQKAEDGVCVVPLRAGDTAWEIERYPEEMAAVLMATDGMYDFMQPYLLKGSENELYIPFVRWFMDNNILNISEENYPEVSESRLSFLTSSNCDPVADDKTIMVVVNGSVVPGLREPEYYAEPDWNRLQEEWNRKAYPGMPDHKEINEEE